MARQANSALCRRISQSYHVEISEIKRFNLDPANHSSQKKKDMAAVRLVEFGELNGTVTSLSPLMIVCSVNISKEAGNYTEMLSSGHLKLNEIVFIHDQCSSDWSYE